jgi:formylglycine-generating enzyme required for sulfatase activity
VEWEYAARGMDEREYPYEGTFDAAKGNTRETGIGQTSAVGVFPDGVSLHNIYNMSGNVFEWCLNDYKNPEIVDGYGNGEPKVVRGGSFYDFQYYARASYRDDPYYPYDGDFNFGFRVVLGSSIAAI